MSKNQAAGHFIFWDDAAIEKEMEVLPKALQEPYRWLKKFAREECGRDLDTLTTRAKLLGVTIDKTNWTRILKGRWKMDAEGNELPNPYVSVVNLLNAIMALYADDAVVEDPVGTPLKCGAAEIRTFYAGSVALELEVELEGPVRAVQNEAAFAFRVSFPMNGKRMTVHPIDVMRFNEAGYILNMRAFFGADNITTV